EIHGKAGQPLTLIARDEIGHVVQLESAMPLEIAEKQPLTTEKLRAQSGRLGGTPFELGELANHLIGDVMLPVSELNRLRREAVSRIESLRAQPKRWTLNQSSGSRQRAAEISGNVPAAATPNLIILVRNLPQLEAAIEAGATTIYCELEDPKK